MRKSYIDDYLKDGMSAIKLLSPALACDKLEKYRGSDQ